MYPKDIEEKLRVYKKIFVHRKVIRKKDLNKGVICNIEYKGNNRFLAYIKYIGTNDLDYKITSCNIDELSERFVLEDSVSETMLQKEKCTEDCNSFDYNYMLGEEIVYEKYGKGKITEVIKNIITIKFSNMEKILDVEYYNEIRGVF